MAHVFGIAPTTVRYVLRASIQHKDIKSRMHIDQFKKNNILIDRVRSTLEIQQTPLEVKSIEVG